MEFESRFVETGDRAQRASRGIDSSKRAGKSFKKSVDAIPLLVYRGVQADRVCSPAGHPVLRE
jgi:hypothetical protein